MTTELMQYNGYRYLLYKREDYGWLSKRSEEEQDALDAGKALFRRANLYHWADQSALVARVQTFLEKTVFGIGLA
jgi:hypothetical protein